METKVGGTSDSGKLPLSDDGTGFREAIRKQLNDEVRKIIDVEMRKAAQELIEEHRKATRQVVDEYRAAIHQIVEEEKEEIWKKADALKKSILQLGL
jgi:TRAP-type C4-dicarboxylate transport system substrate-binding protein